MQNLLLPRYLLALLLLSTACRREADDVQPVQAPINSQYLDLSTAFLRAAQSSPPADEYISGEFDGTPLSFAADPYPGQAQVFHIDQSQHTENCALARATPAGDIQVLVSFVNTDLFSKSLPASWPHANPNRCEQILVDVCAVAPTNTTPSRWYSGGTGFDSPLHIDITSTANGMIEGTFEGKLFQHLNGGPYTGNFFFVKKGKFQLKTTLASI